MNEYQENITAKQIRAQMDYVRNELGGDVEQVVEDAGSLGDIRAYVKAQPIGWVIAAAAAGYFLVPAKKHQNTSASVQSDLADGSKAVKKSSIAGAAFGLATTLATRLITKKITEAGLGLFAGHQSDNASPPSMSPTPVSGNGTIQ